MYKQSKTLINEKLGISIWCGETGCIKICFATLVLEVTIEELKDFMRELCNACPVAKEEPQKTIAAYIMDTPIPSLKFAFTPSQHQYLLQLCQRSLKMVEQIATAN